MHHERGRRHDIVVRDIMTPQDRLEVLDMRDVQRGPFFVIPRFDTLYNRSICVAVPAACARNAAGYERGIQCSLTGRRLDERRRRRW